MTTNNKPAHTPGPWTRYIVCGKVVRDGVELPLPVDDTRLEGESWMEMRDRTRPLREAREKEMQANELLAGAAPLMAEALKEVVKWTALRHDIPTTPTKDIEDQKPFIQQAMMALKAAGLNDENEGV